MLYAWIVFAQVDKVAEKVADKAGKDGDGGGPPIWGPLPMLVMLGVAFYFLIILPGRKERQQRQAMISALKKNDKVITSGGIIGVVTHIKEGTEEVTIKSDETKFVILRSSIARILSEPEKETSTQIKPVT